MPRPGGRRVADPGKRNAPRPLHRLRKRARDRLGERDEFAAYYGGIADQVARQRRARNLSQRELAELCGATQSAIARLESGTRPPRIDTLLRIANALDCELATELRPRTTIKGGPA